MEDQTCSIPCYEEEEDCHLTVVKIFRAKYSESKLDPPILYPVNPIMWHGWFVLFYSTNFLFYKTFDIMTKE